MAASTVESYKNSSKYSAFTNKEHIPDIKSKKRKEWKERSDDSRFTLLSCLRSNSGFDNNAEAKLPNDIQISVTIVDVSRENNNDPSALNTNEDSFVYDLYSTNVECDSDYNDMFMEHLLRYEKH